MMENIFHSGLTHAERLAISQGLLKRAQDVLKREDLPKAVMEGFQEVERLAKHSIVARRALIRRERREMQPSSRRPRPT